MDEERFERLLEAYGADRARWPDAERAPALRYLAASVGARQSLAEARRLDAMLDQWAPGQASPALRERIAAGQPPVRRVRPRAVWLSGVGLAAACAFGVMIGAGFGEARLVAAPVADRESDSAVTAALDGSAEFTPNLDEGWS